MNRTGFAIAGLILVILLFAALASAEVTLTAMTWPPGQEMKPGTSVMIRVQGMEQEDEGAKQPKTKWHIIPARDDDATMLFRDMDGQPLLFFAGQQPGPRTVFLQIESPGLDELPRCDFEYGRKVEPDPDPPPPPPPPGEVTQVAVIWDTDTVKNPQTMLVVGALRSYVNGLDGQPIKWRMADNNQTDGTTGKTPEYLRFGLEAIKTAEVNLPALVVYVRSQGKELAFAYSLPSDGDEAVAIVRGHVEALP